ncbi:MAG: tRNA (guanine(26)-N(2))-dimethyltransferase [Pyrobaculum sp.]
MKYVIREERSVKFLAPDIEVYGSIYSAPVFYNPAMEKNRTLSVLLLKAFGELHGAGLTVCEPLSGTGVRGIRYAVESGVVGRLILNDVSKEAVEIIKKNLNLNGVDAEVYNEDANVLLHRMKGRCDVVDIDPFGSPAPFIHASFRALRDGGLLCATATDAAVLVGKYSRKCLRRYGSVIRKTPFYIELGLRNLLGFIARVAATEDFGVTPLFSYWEGHYFRTCMLVNKGARDADDVLNYVKHIEYKKGFRRVVARPTENSSGPLWVGPLGDPHTTHIMSNYGPYSQFLKTLEEEYSIDVPWFYRTVEFATEGKSFTLTQMLQKLKTAGVYATKTHMAHDGFKSEEPYGALAVFLKRQPSLE